ATGRGEHELLHAQLGRAAQQLERAAHVDVEVLDRVGNRFDDRSGRGQVDHRIGALQRTPHGVGVANVAAHEVHFAVAGEQVVAALREVVQNAHVVGRAEASQQV